MVLVSGLSRVAEDDCAMMVAWCVFLENRVNPGKLTAGTKHGDFGKMMVSLKFEDRFRVDFLGCILLEVRQQFAFVF